MLLVDDRENPKVINKLLMRMGENNVKVCRMVSADYAMGTWGVEAKEINDLFRSILGIGRNRTIVSQLRDLQDNYDNPVLVVYGAKLKPWVATGRPTAKQIARQATTSALNRMHWLRRHRNEDKLSNQNIKFNFLI